MRDCGIRQLLVMSPHAFLGYEFLPAVASRAVPPRFYIFFFYRIEGLTCNALVEKCLNRCNAGRQDSYRIVGISCICC